MVVRFRLVLKVTHFLLEFLDLLFECFHALFNFGMFVTVWFDGHKLSFKSG